MKKHTWKPLAKKTLAMALSASMVVPAVAFFPAGGTDADAAELPEALLTLDWEKGFADGAEGYEGDAVVTVADSEDVAAYTHVETTDSVESGGKVYTYFMKQPSILGTTPEDYYISTNPQGNQPAGYYDAEKGTVLLLDETFHLNAYIRGNELWHKEEEGKLRPDLLINTSDVIGWGSHGGDNKNIVGKEIRPEKDINCGLYIGNDNEPNNPFAKAGDASSLSLSYWIKVPKTNMGINGGEVKPASVIRFQNADVGGSITDDPNMFGFETGALAVSTTNKMAFQAEFPSEFEPAEPDNTWSYAPASDAVSPASASDQWHFVTLNITNEGVDYYLDGAKQNGTATSGSEFNQDGKVKLLSFLKSSKTFVVLGGAVPTDGAPDTSFCFEDADLNRSSRVLVDDLTFYSQALTEAQMEEAIQKGRDEMAARTDATLPEAAAVVTGLDDAAQCQTIGSPSFSTEASKPGLGTILRTSNGNMGVKLFAQEGASPIQGKDLESLTVAYWTKATSAVTASSEANIGVSFIDSNGTRQESDKIDALNPDKQSSSTWVAPRGRSTLYSTTDGGAHFKQGTSNTSYQRLGNTVDLTIKADQKLKNLQDNTAADTDGWNFVMMTITNGGVTSYVNGVKMDSSMSSTTAGARFLDGGITKVQAFNSKAIYRYSDYNEETKEFDDPSQDVVLDNGPYAGTNNEGARNIMSLLNECSDDNKMELYLGVTLTDGTSNFLGNYTGDTGTGRSANFARVSVFTTGLNDQQALQLYQKEVAAINAALPVTTDTPATTEPPVETTEPPVETTEPPVETTEPPVETTEPPVETTEPPVETTEPPVETTEPPVETTEPPVETTEPPVETTEPPVETTEPPVETTEPPVETTEPPVETTEPPVETTEPPVETTEPPVVTEPPVIGPKPTIVPGGETVKPGVDVMEGKSADANDLGNNRYRITINSNGKCSAFAVGVTFDPSQVTLDGYDFTEEFKAAAENNGVALTEKSVRAIAQEKAHHSDIQGKDLVTFVSAVYDESDFVFDGPVAYVDLIVKEGVEDAVATVYGNTNVYTNPQQKLADVVMNYKEPVVTEPPVETTEPPVETTEPPVETTEPPVETTEPPATEDPYMKGDADENGVVDTHDATWVLRDVVQSGNVLTEQGRINANVNDDDFVNTSDAVAILRYVVRQTWE